MTSKVIYPVPEEFVTIFKIFVTFFSSSSKRLCVAFRELVLVEFAMRWRVFDSCVYRCFLEDNSAINLSYDRFCPSTSVPLFLGRQSWQKLSSILATICTAFDGQNRDSYTRHYTTLTLHYARAPGKTIVGNTGGQAFASTTDKAGPMGATHFYLWPEFPKKAKISPKSRGN